MIEAACGPHVAKVGARVTRTSEESFDLSKEDIGRKA